MKRERLLRPWDAPQKRWEDGIRSSCSAARPSHVYFSLASQTLFRSTAPILKAIGAAELACDIMSIWLKYEEPGVTWVMRVVTVWHNFADHSAGYCRKLLKGLAVPHPFLYTIVSVWLTTHPGHGREGWRLPGLSRKSIVSQTRCVGPGRFILTTTSFIHYYSWFTYCTITKEELQKDYNINSRKIYLHQ